MIPKLDPLDLPDRPRAVVLYHFPCADGLASLIATKHRLANRFAIHAIPVGYGSPERPRPIPLDEIASIKPHVVMIVDFSYQPLEIKQMCERFPNLHLVQIIDHHASAIKDWLKTDVVKVNTTSNTATAHQLHYKIGDVNVAFTYPKDQKQLAGSGLTWNALSPVGLDAPVALPPGLQLINDRDLWKLTEDNKRFHAYVSTYLFREEAFAEAEEILLSFSDDAERATASGEMLLAAKANIIDQTVGATLKFGRMQGGFNYDDGAKVTHLECVWRYALIDCTGVLASDAAQAVWDKCDDANQHIDFVASWYTNGDGTVSLSLRSRDASECDVTDIAKPLGGGGHRNASGVSGIPIAKFLDRFFSTIERDLSDLPERHREAGFILVPQWASFVDWVKTLESGETPQFSMLESQRQYLEEMLVPNVIRRHIMATLPAPVTSININLTK